MPYILFETGTLDATVKQKLIDQLTQISVDITGIPKDMFLVTISENSDDNIAIGGKTVTELKKQLKKS